MRLIPLFLCLLFSACAGYQLGGVKPGIMRDVQTIAVPMFTNESLEPRAETLATSAAIDAFIQDGTYRIASTDSADAILEASLHEIDYFQIRSSRLDTLRPEELQNTVTLVWTVRDARGSNRILAQGSSTGTSTFFVDSNLQTSRHNALPDALERASQAMVSRLANGF
ncbi:LPS assembly lipoprotein LptE [Haloferula sp.]|uniref:LPS assembly lipoprotein LptE n=1 Tax=Haloferula sp. TaxID=2497595 RepID=UPI003C796E8D